MASCAVRNRGFTLVELLVVVLVLSILYVVAVPAYRDIARTARVASVQNMAAVVQTAANNVHLACQLDAACASQIGSDSFGFTFQGRYAKLNYGWLDAGDQLGGGLIDDWVVSSGFTPVLEWNGATGFRLDEAPDPSNCRVTYGDAYFRGADAGAIAVAVTGGC